jgi:Arc/MetJ family transcription regulator
MRTEKVSLSLEEELLAEAREAVGARGLSSYVNRALRQQLQHDRLAGLLAELEQEHGPIDPRVLEEVREAWPTSEERAIKRRSA